jgi:modulator of FtsH protease
VAYDAEAWSDFFVATAGSSAALAGLVFVAVSINIERILALPGVPDRALQTLLLLLGALIVSFFGLAPGQSETAVGVELAATGAGLVAVTGLLSSRIRARSTRPAADMVAIALLALLGTAPFLISGLSLLAEAGGGLYWVLAGMVAAVLGAVINAWVLLVEILR